MDILIYADERLAFIRMLLLLAPAVFYALGLMEGKLGIRFFTVGLGLHGLSLLQRGIELGGLPLTEKHDTISLMALAMALSYAWLYGRRTSRGLEFTLLPLAVAFVFVAVKHRTLNTVSPFMLSPWFYLHVLFYFTSYAVLGASACMGLLYVISGDAEQERMQYRVAALGWALLSAALLFGSIWFYSAYGTYWLWTSKELWITITWLGLGLYLHVRLIGRFQGRPAAVLGCLCFAAALFTYFGVGTVIPAPPTQF